MKLLEPSAPTLQPQKKSITELDINDRPREKFMTSGGSSLSAAELLAILVGSGNDKENAVTLMQRILSTAMDNSPHWANEASKNSAPITALDQLKQ